MKTRRILLLGCLVLAAAGLAGCPSSLNGYWMTYDGSCLVEVFGNQMGLVLDFQEAVVGTMTTNTGTSPCQIDLNVIEATGPYADLVGERLLGLYEVNGQQLQLVFAEPDTGARPSSLDDDTSVVVCLTAVRVSY